MTLERKRGIFDSLFCLVFLPSAVFLGVACNNSTRENDKKRLLFYNQSLSATWDSSVSNGKGLILLSNSFGCSQCEMFEADLVKDDNYGQSVYRDFVISRVDYNAVGNQWLVRMLNKMQFPIFLFFDRTKKLAGLEVGVINKDSMAALLRNTLEGNSWLDNGYELDKNTLLKKEDIFGYLDNLLKAKLTLEHLYTTRKRSTILIDSVLLYLNKSITVYPSFYNQYLKSRVLLAKGDTTGAITMANKVLSVKEPRALFLNKDLRREMHLLTFYTNKLKFRNIPYAGIENGEINIGKLTMDDTDAMNATFAITNIGGTDLILKKVQTDCNCLAPSFTKTVIAPGKSKDLKIQIRPQRTGEFRHIINIATNDPDSVIHLHIRGRFH